MNREIKFRGKKIMCEEPDDWCYGSYLQRTTRYAQKKYYIFEESHKRALHGRQRLRDCYLDFYEVYPETVGQFTGLHDKDGKEIYEGDIFKTSNGFVAVVEWDAENGRFLGFTVDRKIVYVGREPAVEVIGNIHDNPELLKSE